MHPKLTPSNFGRFTGIGLSSSERGIEHTIEFIKINTAKRIHCIFKNIIYIQNLNYYKHHITLKHQSAAKHGSQIIDV